MRITITAENGVTDRLCCPQCNSIYIHQGRVEIFFRREDAKTGRYISADFDDIQLNSNLLNNPSPRRQGMLIHFNCEECGKNHKLAMYQHKGETYMDWLSAEEIAVCTPSTWSVW